jgi:hypothetical protein
LRFFRPALIAAALLPGLMSVPLPASLIDSVIERIQRSEFVFGAARANAPFPPIGWVNATSYDNSELNLANGRIEFDEFSASQALFGPVWVGKKDLILVGESLLWQEVDFEDPLTAQREIRSAMPLVGWLRQTGPKSQLGAFAAPEFVSGGGYEGYELDDFTLYTGVIGTYLASDRLMWIYGGVAYFTDYEDTLLPYLGVLWTPSDKWSVSIIAPWPSISYAPTRDYMFQFGLSPAGAVLAATNEGNRLRVSYDSWNLLLSAHRRLHRFLWVSAGVGWSGLGSFTVTSDGDANLETKLNRGLVWSLQLSLRPPTATGN